MKFIFRDKGFFLSLPYLMAYKMHPNFNRANQRKSTNKYDEMDIMKIVNENTCNLHKSLK